MPALLPSEIPVLARAQPHWIVLLRRPHRVLSVALVVLVVAAAFQPNPMVWVLLLVLAAAAYLRWQAWRAEWVILTGQRIIRVRGILETTTSEASLRLDRISGAVLEQTVLGKILNYGSIELEAPGQHPDVRHLVKIAHPHPFYLQVRYLVFGGPSGDPDRGPDRRSDRDPGTGPQNYNTAPLPQMPPGWPS